MGFQATLTDQYGVPRVFGYGETKTEALEQLAYAAFDYKRADLVAGNVNIVELDEAEL